MIKNMPKKKKDNIIEEVKEEMREDKIEFPDSDIGFDIFSQTGEKTEESEKKQEKKEEKVEEKEKEKAAETEEKEEKPRRKITKKELEEKAEKLRGKIKEEKTEDIKEKFEKERKTLVPLEDYIKYGACLGTKVITPHMKEFVYRRRNDGIAVMNTNIIDKRIKEMIKLLVKYNPEDFIVVSKREAGWEVAKKFAEVIGARVFVKKYPAGILTNIKLPNFFETDMVFVIDPWLDKNAIKDANIVRKPVLALCDTNNYTFGINFFIPCNNKSDKSIGFILYILAREYLAEKKIDKEVKLSDFVKED